LSKAVELHRDWGRYPDCVGANAVALKSSCVRSCHAQNRNRGGEAVSGSVRPDPGIAVSRAMLDALARALEARDESTHQHAQRVQHYAMLLAVEHCDGDTRMIEAIHAAALLHDIGKLALPDQILHKPGPLTREEYEQVKQHVIIGADILSSIPCTGALALIVRHHHENWDGTGYPDGLSGESIPIGARVLAIVDCYDALTSERPYRRKLTHDAAIGMLRDRRGSMYDPGILDTFMRLVSAERFAALALTEAPAIVPPAPKRVVWLRESRA